MQFTEMSYAFEYQGKETSPFVLRSLQMQMLHALGVICSSGTVIEYFNIMPFTLVIEEDDVLLMNHDADVTFCAGGRRGEDDRHGDHYAFTYEDYVIKLYGDFSKPDGA